MQIRLREEVHGPAEGPRALRLWALGWGLRPGLLRTSSWPEVDKELH